MTCDKVVINGPNLKKLAQKKIKLAKVVAKEKKNPSANPDSVLQKISVCPATLQIFYVVW